MNRAILAIAVIAVISVSALATLLYYRRWCAPSSGGDKVMSPPPQRWGYFKYPGGEVSVESPSAPQYALPLDLSQVKNAAMLRLSGRAAKLLKENGFVVLPGRYLSIADYYSATGEMGWPVFITTDSVLFVYHAFFDNLLREMEEQKFAPILGALLSSLVKSADGVYQREPSGSLSKRAAELDVAYLSVALKLLDPEFQPPSYVKELVSKELELIMSASNPYATSPIFGYKEDYTQYKPRGHYTRSELLKRYFRCMMWLGRMRFEAVDPQKPELARVQTAQALILSYLMVTTKVKIGGKAVKALEAWEAVYLPTAFIVGRSDDLTFYEYLTLMKKVYGSFKPGDVNDGAKLEKFMKEVAEMSRSRIISSPIYPGEEQRLAGLRFMGQRFTLDGYVLQEVCHPKVRERFKVSGLDVAAVLGSDRAMDYLKGEFSKYPDLKGKIAELRREVDNLDRSNWTSSLYMGWLYSIRALLSKPPAGYPTFMQTTAWLDKSLNTALASWAQLKHDTILYSKQPYATLTGVPPRPSHPGYVEPNPELYSRLRGLVRATISGLSSFGLLSGDMEKRLKLLDNVLTRLTEISLKELKGQPLSEDDRAFIKGYGLTLAKLLAPGALTDVDPRVIADVYTEPNSRTVLEVGTGYFDEIVVVYKTPDGSMYVARGLVMSYYEFYWPQQNRLTDEQWRAMLEKGSAPPTPSWTASFKA